MSAKNAKIVRLRGPEWYLQDRAPAKDIAIRRSSRRGFSAKYYTVKEISVRLQISKDVIFDAIRSGLLDAQPVSRVYRISEEAVEDYLFRLRLQKGGN